jgi:hypothetical protein
MIGGGALGIPGVGDACFSVHFTYAAMRRLPSLELRDEARRARLEAH